MILPPLAMLGESVDPNLELELDAVASLLESHPGLVGVRDRKSWLLNQVGCLRNLGSNWFSEERNFGDEVIHRFAIQLGRQLLDLPHNGVTVARQVAPRILERYKSWFSDWRTLPDTEGQSVTVGTGRGLGNNHRDGIDAVFIPVGFRAELEAERRGHGARMYQVERDGPRVLFMMDPSGFERRGACGGIYHRDGDWIAYRWIKVFDERDQRTRDLQEELFAAQQMEQERSARERQAHAAQAMQQTLTPQVQQARQALHQDRLRQDQLEAQRHAQQQQAAIQQQMAMQQMLQQQQLGPPMTPQHQMAFPPQYFGEGEATMSSTKNIAKIERRHPVPQPTEDKPILAWQARDQYGQPQGPPLPVNPQQALRLMGREPDPLTLAERNHYADLAGLGRFAIEVASDGATDPVELGALGSIGDVLLKLAKRGAVGVARRKSPQAAKLVELGFDNVPRLMRLAKAVKGKKKGKQEYLQSLVDRAISAADQHRADEKARRIAKEKLLKEKEKHLKDAKGLLKEKQEHLDQVAEKKGLLKRLMFRGIDGIDDEGTLERSTLGERIGRRCDPDGIALALGLLEAGHAGLKRRGKEHSIAGLAVLDRLAGADLEALAHGHSGGYRPTLGEYSLACCCKRPTKDVQQLSQYAALGGFDLGTDPKAANLAAVGRLGLTSFLQDAGRALGIDAEKFVSNVGNVVRNVSRTVDDAFRKVPQDGQKLTQPMIEAARTSVDQLRQSEQRLAQQAQTIQRMENAMRQVQQRLQNVENVRSRGDATVTQMAAAEEAITRLKDGQKQIGEQLQKAIAEWRAEQQAMRSTAATAKPIVQAAKQAKEAAEKEEGIRVEAARKMYESGLGRGNLVTLTEREYAEMIREREETKTAIKEAQRNAKALAEARKKDIGRLTTMKEEESRLLARIKELEAQIADKAQEKEVRDEKEKAREQLTHRVRELQQSFEDQLRTIRESTAEAIEKASDVTNQSGMQMMFDFLGNLVRAMRQVKDVSSASEFLQLFPRVLDQLRRAQQIAQPEAPRVDVTVPTPTFSPRFEPRFEIDPSLFVTPAPEPETQP